jgi:ATP-dependent Clp protease protease subunit
MPKRKFWNFATNTEGERTLYLDGPIAEETWLGDEVTPAEFRAELDNDSEPITVWINSPGGDVFAAAEIYTMLKEYEGRVTVKIDSLAASAASVVAMAGDEIQMSPVSMLMMHNPSTIAWGDSAEMRRARAMLDEIKESLINAYEAKTGLPRNRISRMMTSETWMNAHTAVELGFADKVMYMDESEASETAAAPEFIWNRGRADVGGMMFSMASVTNSMLGKVKQEPQCGGLCPTAGGLTNQTPKSQAKFTPVKSLYERLEKIKIMEEFQL